MKFNVTLSVNDTDENSNHYTETSGLECGENTTLKELAKRGLFRVHSGVPNCNSITIQLQAPMIAVDRSKCRYYKAKCSTVNVSGLSIDGCTNPHKQPNCFEKWSDSCVLFEPAEEPEQQEVR